jgi:alanyl-tRNA synthetase
LRLIEVHDFDLSACGGTHVARTGAIGSILVAASERFRGGSRITFVCGGRALKAYGALRDAIAGSVRTLSVLPADLPAAIERVQAESRDLRRQLKDLQNRVAFHEADALASAAVNLAEVKLVSAVLKDWDAAGLKLIASRIAERPNHVAVLVSEPPPASIVIARGAGVRHEASALLRAILSTHGGKGGGRPELAQGGGVVSRAADVFATVRDFLTS